jgi:hypothetical protein
MAFGEVHLVIERELAPLSFQVRAGQPAQLEDPLDPEFRKIGASGLVLDALGDSGCFCRRPPWW